jgi:hypothetical protein
VENRGPLPRTGRFDNPRNQYKSTFQSRYNFPNPDTEAPFASMSKLRILVPIKRVLDYAIKPRVKKDQSGVDLSIPRNSFLTT